MRILEVVVIGVAMFAAGYAHADDIPPGLENHYLCNKLAELGYQMNPDEAMACSANYEWLKASFMTVSAQEWGNTDDRGRAKIMTQAYQDFKAWEEANADLVASLYDAMEQIARDQIE